MRKKAQVTVFIILGVILLLIAGLVLYLTTQKIIKPIEEQIIIPEGTEPVYDHIAECVYETAKNGIIQMGMQGGYLNLPAEIAKTPASHISLDPYGTFKIPYWYYNKKDMTPTKEFLEMEINSHLRQELENCIDFESLKPQYNVIPRGEFSPKTTLTEDSVIIELTWPIEIKKSQKTIKINKIAQEIDVKLKQIHDIAKETMHFENQKSTFENITLGLISANPDIPTNGMSIDCTPKKWHLTEIKDKAQNMLKYNIPSIRIENTPYPEFTEPRRAYEKMEKEYENAIKDLERDKEPNWPNNIPEDSYEYFKMLLDIGISPTDIKTSFRYSPEWGMSLLAYPREGNTLQSNKIQGNRKYLSYLCLNQWHFTYDIQYPIVMTLKDETAFKGEGYVFQFAFPVIIDDNRITKEVIDASPFTTSEYYEFCGERGNIIYDITATGIIPGAMFATELEEANITYQCLDQYCELGQTKADQGIYRLKTTLPTGCDNPFITAAKKGYLPATKQLTEQTLEIPLKKLKTLNYEILIHPYDSRTGEYRESRKPRNTEEISLSIGVEDFYQQKAYEKGEQTIELIDGTAEYETNIFASRADSLIGGYSNEKMQITYDELKGKEKIIFHIFEYIPVPQTDQEKAEIISYLYEGKYQQTLKPTFE